MVELLIEMSVQAAVETGLRGTVSFSEISQEGSQVLCNEFWAFYPKEQLTSFASQK